MKKTILALAVALLAGIGAANAQDLKLDRTGLYVGGNLGSSLDADSRTLMGVVVGGQVHQYLRVEGTYDYNSRQGSNGQAIMVNAVPQYRIPGTVVTPYALLGAGYGFDAMGNNGDAKPVYNLGLGVRVALSEKWEVDARYRHLNTFTRDFNENDTQMATVGLNYRF